MPVADLISMLSTDQVEFADIHSVCSGDGEFMLEKAAVKWSKRTLSSRTEAAMTDIGWEPAHPWRRVYQGPLNVQHWEVDARRMKSQLKVKQLEEDIARASKLDTGTMTDDQYAANRRRMIELKMERAKLRSDSQGGDNA